MRLKTLFHSAIVFVARGVRFHLMFGFLHWRDAVMHAAFEKKFASGTKQLEHTALALASLKRSSADNFGLATTLESELFAVKDQVEALEQHLLFRAESVMEKAAAAARQQEQEKANIMLAGEYAALKKEREDSRLCIEREREEMRQASMRFREEKEAEIQQVLLDTQNSHGTGRAALLQQLRETESEFLKQLRDQKAPLLQQLRDQEAALLQQLRTKEDSCNHLLQNMKLDLDSSAERERCMRQKQAAKEAEHASAMHEAKQELHKEKQARECDKEKFDTTIENEKAKQIIALHRMKERRIAICRQAVHRMLKHQLFMAWGAFVHCIVCTQKSRETVFRVLEHFSNPQLAGAFDWYASAVKAVVRRREKVARKTFLHAQRRQSAALKLALEEWSHVGGMLLIKSLNQLEDRATSPTFGHFVF